jgi:hypothetical protein
MEYCFCCNEKHIGSVGIQCRKYIKSKCDACGDVHDPPKGFSCLKQKYCDFCRYKHVVPVGDGKCLKSIPLTTPTSQASSIKNPHSYIGAWNRFKMDFLDFLLEQEIQKSLETTGSDSLNRGKS